MTTPTAPRILVIAGTDSSGGAGLTRDTAVATELGCRVAPVVTAVTAQTSGALEGVHPVPAQLIGAQITAALKEAPVAAIKIGMLGTADAARVVADHLPAQVPVVLDPVLKTSSGGQLGNRESLAPLLARVTLLTPNLIESATLTGTCVGEGMETLSEQARLLLAIGLGTGAAPHTGPEAILIKGGHGSGTQSRDHLFTRAQQLTLTAPRLRQGQRGTGCTLATAIACWLAKGMSVPQACAEGKQTVTDWLIRQQPGPLHEGPAARG